MANDRFEIEPEPVYRDERKGGGCLKGCLIAGVVMLILFALLAFWVARNWKGWLADFGSDAVDQLVDQSDLPAQEKVEVKEQAARLTEAFKNGQLSGEKLATVMEQLINSPLMTSLVVTSIEKKYFDASGLTDEEKQAGRVALRRFVRGMIDKKIAEADFEEVMSKIADKKGEDQWELRETVTDEELRELIQLTTEKADAAEIPAEVEEVDVSDEMRRIIDEALGEVPAA